MKHRLLCLWSWWFLWLLKIIQVIVIALGYLLTFGRVPCWWYRMLWSQGMEVLSWYWLEVFCLPGFCLFVYFLLLSNILCVQRSFAIVSGRKSVSSFTQIWTQHTTVISSIARKARWYNSGMEVAKITISLWAGPQCCAAVGNINLVSLSHNPLNTSHTTTTIFQKGHSISLSSKYETLCSLTKEILTSHKKCFIMRRRQKIHRLTSGQNIDNKWHEWSVQKETSVLHFLPLMLRKHCARVQEGLLWSNVFWSRLVHLPNQSRNSPPEIKIDNISDGEGSTLQHFTTRWEAIHNAVIASVGQKVSLL